MRRLNPIVAMTIGSTPVSSNRAITTFSKNTPSRSVETRIVPISAAANGQRNTLRNSTIVNAGSTTNPPSAKLIVLDVCHRRTNPMAVIA